MALLFIELEDVENGMWHHVQFRKILLKLECPATGFFRRIYFNKEDYHQHILEVYCNFRTAWIDMKYKQQVDPDQDVLFQNPLV